MKIFATAASIGLLTIAASGAAQDIWSAAPKDASIKAWQGWYHQREQFFDHKDLKDLSLQIDEHCKVIAPDGKVAPGNGVDTLRGLFGVMSEVKTSIHVLSVKKEKDAYDVTIRYSFHLATKPGADHKQVHVTVSGTSLNVWKPSGSKLLLAEVKALTVKNTMDGKPG